MIFFKFRSTVMLKIVLLLLLAHFISYKKFVILICLPSPDFVESIPLYCDVANLNKVVWFVPKLCSN